MLRAAAENRKQKKRVSNSKKTCCWRQMQIHSLPAGGAFGAAETEVSPVTAVNKAALPALMNATLPDKI